MVPVIYLMHGDLGNMGFFLALYALTYAGWVGGVKASDTGGGYAVPGSVEPASGQ
jgi:hypothetical protein